MVPLIRLQNLQFELAYKSRGPHSETVDLCKEIDACCDKMRALNSDAGFGDDKTLEGWLCNEEAAAGITKFDARSNWEEVESDHVIPIALLT